MTTLRLDLIHLVLIHSSLIHFWVFSKRKKEKIIRAGGAGYKIVELFNGGAESYFHSGKIKKWDICAGEAILKSTCYGKMTDMNGEQIDYR